MRFEVVSEENPVPVIDTSSAVPVLRKYADQADRESRLPQEMVDAMTAAGLFRMGVPLTLGGRELDVETSIPVFAEVGAACASCGWVAAISYGSQQVAGAFGDRVREELWGDSPDVPICSSLNGTGVTANAVAGGVEISGRWPWASGCHEAHWAELDLPLPDGGYGLVLVPMSELTIESSWNMVGMRGTASDTIVAEGVVVPSHRIKSMAEIVSGKLDGIEPLYRVPAGAMTLALAAALLGATREVYAQTIQAVERGKPLSMSFYRSLADAPSVQAALADAANLIDTAELHMFRSARRVTDASAAGAELTMRQRTRLRMDGAYAVQSMLDAVQLLMTVRGGSAFAHANDIQRPWRDLQTAARHPALNLGLAREMYGRVLAGIEEPISGLI
ncbi:indole oxygenase [Actinoplanes sp. TBRC 11911]|uniref:acyl-CoA dehydrogenase family protein n=1 Tax=Actinoplanes sp. TBRC 11911 TaxID=2729386 RepID=UPI00145DC86D|nr:acyl-CoA dehydrogenase family protein [Actinoplanes sp. TBRC 11911]NMO55503.1 indole oxygenase [Actinoplanes sp. TBRC 11911]